MFCGRVPSLCLVRVGGSRGVAAQAGPRDRARSPNTSAPGASASAPALRALHAQLAQLRESPLAEPLVLVSVQADKRLQGDVYAELTLPMGVCSPCWTMPLRCAV